MAKAPIDIRSLARCHTERAIQVLAGIMRDGTTEAARVTAAIALLDRGWGKPPASLEVTSIVKKVARVPMTKDEWNARYMLPALPPPNAVTNGNGTEH